MYAGFLREMNLSDFDYQLPAELIAQRPLEERDASRLLLLDRGTGAVDDRAFRELPRLLRGDELIVVNNARVLPARLFGRREGVRAGLPGARSAGSQEFLSAQIEVLLVRQRDENLWEALVKPGRKIRVGERIVLGDGELVATVEGRGGYGLRLLRFGCAGNFADAVARLGHVPLPPYIKRGDEALDRERYQTVYAREGAAVAAPTAGLHFTAEILEQVRRRGVAIAEVTLDVGLGTFEPVRTGRIEDHKIHSESYEISQTAAEAIEAAKAAGRPVVAVGTTVVRAIEDAAEQAEASGGQGDAVLAPGRREARIFLYPGKPFRVVDQLLTNFHLPKSTLLALVCGFAGRERVLAAYRHAVEQRYRFYSYGDCMLVR